MITLRSALKLAAAAVAVALIPWRKPAAKAPVLFQFWSSKPYEPESRGFDIGSGPRGRSCMLATDAARFADDIEAAEAWHLAREERLTYE